MSFERGKAYNDSLKSLCRGDALPDRDVPVEYITYDLWQSMREHDERLANDILDPVFTFMDAQTNAKREHFEGLGVYLKYREGDVGKA